MARPGPLTCPSDPSVPQCTPRVPFLALLRPLCGAPASAAQDDNATASGRAGPRNRGKGFWWLMHPTILGHLTPPCLCGIVGCVRGGVSTSQVAARGLGLFFRRLRSRLYGEAPRGTAEPDGLHIRSMTQRDLVAVVAIESEAFSGPWRASSYARAVGTSSHNFYIVELNGELVGYAGFWVEGPDAHIAKVAVHADHRCRGIGSTLLRHLLDQARRLGLSRAYLEVRRGNLRAQALYRRLGFRFERIQPAAYPDDGEDALVFVRDDLLEVKAQEP